ncbi:heme lyase CcmF/NrfE family subunit [Beggiatoa leptomitoformis]|uniref:Heme lyase CcmF/NrfE family subunit n=1 Tax=Beggiatoa leptomitoformis TaxID=288004 RepID=A0A2N9YHP1_9GAMM|nr:heme lyase CcmF/NrfE family subunit [Beggiatoa leptomitoformis]ALG67741.1 heme lyase CcmF/NrfE family subunit [Beggiatoa leptomitoformis]AUI70017.1 heme lyase CcmF/NrfE family subunit [Beggiatoa leptomitoformis]
MIPELGHFALILALCLAMVQLFFPLVGATRNIPNWMAVARPAAVGQLVFILLAYCCLTYAFITNDFSVSYVAQNSNSQLPLIYRIVSVWGGHEGSLLLWVMTLGFWTVAVAIISRHLPIATLARVLSVMGFISAGFLLFLIVTSNPFDRLAVAPANGRDLNPLLQDPGLIIHPPMLYMGYVGFSVAFSFAIAALLSGQLDSAWTRWSRPWTLIAWMFLTVGIALGSWWAYYELGWGGWWFWDPVENASFMPWLVGTALIHSLAVTEKRGAFKSWTVLLAIITFSLSLLGTFLVRSGVLTSVHAFATDPERGIFILAFLGTVIGISLLLYAWRAPKMGKGGHFDLFSKETLLLLNNVFLVVAAACILLGTLYPLFLDALNLGKISVGPPYFDKVFFFLIAPLMLLLGFGSLTHWKSDNPRRVIKQLWFLLLMSIVLGVAVPVFYLGEAGLVVFPGLAVAFWILFTVVKDIREKIRNKPTVWQGLRDLPRGFYGMTIAHLGVAVFVVGVTLTNAYSVEQDVRLEPNVELDVAAHHFIFEKIEQVDGPNYKAERATVRVQKDGEDVAVLHPEKRNYLVRSMPMTEAGIDAGLFRDIYVSMGEPLGGGAWSVRIYYKPFIRWIWLGALFMAFAGFLSATDRRYRRIAEKTVKKTEAQFTQPVVV